MFPFTLAYFICTYSNLLSYKTILSHLSFFSFLQTELSLLHFPLPSEPKAHI